MDKDKDSKDAEANRWESRIRELQMTIQRNESVIQMLQQQLGEMHDESEEVRNKDASFIGVVRGG